MEIPRSLQILKEACERNAVAFEIVDEFSGFIARLSKNGESRLVGAAWFGVYPLNRAAPFAIARDKAFTHHVLESAGFRTPPGGHFFLSPREDWNRPPGRDRTDALRFAEKLSDKFARPLVVKPNSGKGARHVTLVSSRQSLEAAFDAIVKTDAIVLVQSLIEAPEYRLFLVDGEIVFAYGKARPAIECDGESTIAALLRARESGAYNQTFLDFQLGAAGLSLQSVLAKGRRLETDFVANLAAGGSFTGFIDPHPALRAWAARAARAVSLRVTGLDVFSSSGLADPSDIVVTDVNGFPNLSTLYDLGHKVLVMDVWRLILEKTFEEGWPKGF